MMSFLKNFDFLGETFNFSINKSLSFKTVPGGLLSFLILFSYVFFFYIFGIDFIFKRNPNTYSEIRIPKDTGQSLNLNETEFLFGISAFNLKTKKFINISELLTPVLTYSEKTNNDSEPLKTKKFSTIPCNFLDTNQFSNNSSGLENFICPNITELKDKAIIGDIFDKNYSFLSLDLNICKDLKNISNCNLSDLIEEFQSGYIVIWIIYPEINYDTDNYEQPFTINFRNEFTFLDLQLIIIDNLHFMGYLLEDDIGILYENKNQTKNYGGQPVVTKYITRKNKLSKDSFNKTDLNFINELDNRIYSINIVYRKNIYYFTRKYMKFQDLLGNIRGFMELLIFIFGFFYKFYNKFRLDTYLFNRLIIIKDENILENRNFSLELYQKSSKSKIKEKELDDENKKNQKDKFTHLFESDISYQIENKKNDQFNNSFENSKNIKHINQTENSIDDNNKNLENGKENIRIREKFNVIFMKFFEYKNSISFKFLEFCKYILCGRKLNNSIKRNEVLEEFCEKLYFKFDIFYYFKMIKKNKILRKSILNSDQDLFLKISSKKLYNYGYIIKQKLPSINDSKEILDKTWKYYISEAYDDQNSKNIDKNMKCLYFE